MFREQLQEKSVYVLHRCNHCMSNDTVDSALIGTQAMGKKILPVACIPVNR